METVKNSTENRLKLLRTLSVHSRRLSFPRLSHFLRQVQQLSSGDTSTYIMGVMLESNLVEGRQDIPHNGPAGLKYGQSVTDACLSWEMTVPALDRLREGVRARRELVAQNVGSATCDIKETNFNSIKATNGANGANGT